MKPIGANPVWVSLLLTLLFGLTACGGGGGTGPSAAPTVSAFSLSAKGAYLGSSGGNTSVSGQVHFSSPGGSLSSATVTVVNGTGNKVSSQTVPIQGASPGSSGTISASGSISTTVLGTYTVQVYVTDSAGQNSNTVSATFRITNFPWTTLPPMPTARKGPAAVAVGSKFYVMGGAAYVSPPEPSVATVEIYDAATETWSQGPAMPVAIQHMAAAAVNGLIYVLAGSKAYDGCAQITTTYEFNPATGVWTTKSALPSPLTESGVAVAGSKIYVFGGVVASSQCPATSTLGTVSAAVNIYDTATDTWTPAAPLPAAASGLGTATINGKIIAFAGYGPQGSGTYIPTAEYDPASNAWTQRASVLPVTDAPTATVGGVAYLFADGFAAAYDPVTDTWPNKEPAPSPAFVLVGPSADVYNGKIYVFDTFGTFVYNPPDDLN